MRDASFEIRAGEIVGVAGLVGCGKSELALALGGAVRASGEIRLRSRRRSPSLSPRSDRRGDRPGARGPQAQRDPPDQDGAAQPLRRLGVDALTGRRPQRRGGTADGAGIARSIRRANTLALHADRPALGRQPAEGRARPLVRVVAGRRRAQRTDARHRRRREERGLPADPGHGGGRGRRPHDFLGAARAARALRPRSSSCSGGGSRPTFARGEATEEEIASIAFGHGVGRPSPERPRTQSARPPWAIRRRLSPGRYTGVLIGVGAIVLYLSFTEPVFLTWENWQNIMRSAGRRADARARDDLRGPDGRDRPLDRLRRRRRPACSLGLAIEHGAPWWLGCLAGIGAGLCFGLANGVTIGVLKIPFFVVTLGTLVDLPEHRPADDERADRSRCSRTRTSTRSRR